MAGIFLFLCLSSKLTQADPWFTGPLLALAGQAVPKGQTQFELYNLYSPNHSIYDNEWKNVITPKFVQTQFVPEFSYGFGDNIDFEIDPTYVINQTQGATRNKIGDTTAFLGYQVLQQGDSRSRPNLRITLQETFPTGIYDHLNPDHYTAGATGLGSYQTGVGLNFELLSHMEGNHYLNSYFCLTYIYPASVPINGLSAYGGTTATSGRIKPGNILNIDLAGELTLTQNWVGVMEFFFSYEAPDKFTGYDGGPPSKTIIVDEKNRRRILINRLFPNRHNIGQTIGSSNSDQVTLAPAIEYNFSENYGVIGGVWYSVAGKNTPNFATYSLAFLASW